MPDLALYFQLHLYSCTSVPLFSLPQEPKGKVFLVSSWGGFVFSFSIPLFKVFNVFYENHPFTLFPIHLAAFFAPFHAFLMVSRCLYPLLMPPNTAPVTISPTPKGVGPARVPAAKSTSPPDPRASKMASVRSWPVELMAFTVCMTVSVPEIAMSAQATNLPNLLRANPPSLTACLHGFFVASSSSPLASAPLTIPLTCLKS